MLWAIFKLLLHSADFFKKNSFSKTIKVWIQIRMSGCSVCPEAIFSTIMPLFEMATVLLL